MVDVPNDTATSILKRYRQQNDGFVTYVLHCVDEEWNIRSHGYTDKLIPHMTWKWEKIRIYS